MAGRRSSVDTAKTVFAIACCTSFVTVLNRTPPSISGIEGNSSASSPISLYLPLSVLNSTLLSSSTEKKTGILGSCLSVSSTLRAGIATEPSRSEEHTSELQSRGHLVCRLLLEKKKY